MIARWFPPKRASHGWTLVALLGLLPLAGCGGDRYPEDLTYPVRSDPLVTEAPDFQPAGFDKPGDVTPLLHDQRVYSEEKARSLVLFPERDPRTGKVGVAPEVRDLIGEELERLFGTPRDPKVPNVNADGKSIRAVLRLSASRLARGSRLYRLHCVHCHGLTGNGHGHTAAWVNPHPRDYRTGVFKFTSSDQPIGSRKPRRADLLRTVRQGVEGTSMPSFALLPDRDLEDMVGYVIHLSLRGQVEFKLLKDLMTPGGFDLPRGAKARRSAIRQQLTVNARGFAAQWVQAQASLIKPGAGYPYKNERGEEVHPGNDPKNLLKESVQNGQRVFLDSKRGGCIGCHFDYGRQPQYFYDTWGSIVKPRDLVKGVYRGGRRPIDLYWRIHGGIDGANMAALLEGEGPADKERRAWDLVNFLEVLPFPEMRRKYDVKID